jgi:malate dehydrogenase (oxaloacetate-decarboxylating)
MENEGLSASDAKKQIWVVDENGLLHDERRDLSPEQRLHAQPYARTLAWQRKGSFNLHNVTRNVRASALVEFPSGRGMAMRQQVIEEMAERTKRPIILTTGYAAELKPNEIRQWSEGRALFSACGTWPIFSAVGLAVTVSRATRITTRMMLAGARALASYSSLVDDANGPLLPPISDLREAVVDVATAIALEAQNEGFAPHLSSEELRQEVRETQWTPRYPALVHALTV